jgi:hypothetical protein
MIHYDAVFELNEKEKIVIYSPEPLETLHFCSRALIIFLYETQYVILNTDSLHEALETFCRLLLQAQAGQLLIDSSLQEDLGYLYNKSLDPARDTRYLMLMNYFLWSPIGNTEPKMGTWLYNKSDDSIILEIIPLYRWDFENAENEDDFISLNSFLKEYKPYFIRTIEPQVAQQWYTIARQIVVQIEKNIQKEFDL